MRASVQMHALRTLIPFDCIRLCGNEIDSHKFRWNQCEKKIETVIWWITMQNSKIINKIINKMNAIVMGCRASTERSKTKKTLM